MNKEILDQGIDEAYNLLASNILRNLSDDLEESYNHYEYLDFSDEVFEFLEDNHISEILEPAIQTICKRVSEALQE